MTEEEEWEEEREEREEGKWGGREVGRKRRGEGRREGGKGWRGRKGSGEREEEEVVEAEGEKRDTYADFYHDITITNLEVQFKL